MIERYGNQLVGGRPNMRLKKGGIISIGQPVDHEYYKEKFRWTATYTPDNPIREILRGEPAGEGVTRHKAMLDLLKVTQIVKVGDYQT